MLGVSLSLTAAPPETNFSKIQKVTIPKISLKPSPGVLLFKKLFTPRIFDLAFNIVPERTHLIKSPRVATRGFWTLPAYQAVRVAPGVSAQARLVFAFRFPGYKEQAGYE